MKIIGTGRAHPAKVVTNAMLEGFLDTSDEGIRTRRGIGQRRVISSERLEDLATEASLKAIDDAGLTPTDIDYIICSNVVNEYITPALSCIVQGAIGARCAAVDINGACSGFIYALDMADDRIRSGKARNVLVMAAEKDCLFPGEGVIKRAKEIIPNCTTYLIKGRGHMNIMTDEEKEMIREFF